MKTAISIPDDIFQQADRIAKRLAVSRSQLYTQAVEAFLARHQERKVTEKLDEVYAREESALDSGLRQMQTVSLPGSSW